MRRYRIPSTLAAAAALAFLLSPAGPAQSPRRAPSVRAQKDTIGYATRPSQVASLVRLVDSLEARRIAENAAAFPRMGEAPMIGALCPHDDYLYAGRGYVHAIRGVEAPRVILFGVCHSARRRGIQERLVFESSDAWRGALGDCPVSPLRCEILDALPPDLVLVSDDIHAEEHSLEGLVPILVHYVPEVEIVPILVTRLRGDGMFRAADTLAAAVSKLMSARGWKLGKDVAVLISADCVHYGDEQWGGRDYAPFGVDEAGYAKGVERDLDVVRSSLTGTIGDGKIALFRERVENDDFQNPYKITWCGVYSIPFGLAVLDRLCALEGREAPEGFMLVHGTSIEPEKLALEHTGLGTTAVNTLRHWVGYTAVGYW